MPITNPELRHLPSVDALLNGAGSLIGVYGKEKTTHALRHALQNARERILVGESVNIDPESLIQTAHTALIAQFLPTLRGVINATGVIIHTNLGRAPLAKSAQDAMIEVASGYSTLEYDLGTGKRGSRHTHAEALICEITGAESAMVVNNNAAAVLLMLSALANGHEVILSRGQLVEIGGGFRVPDVMMQSGATLVEVGTTNRTRIADYEKAITPQTSALLRVHSSNFKQIGFVEITPLHHMAKLAHEKNLILLDDLGSGALVDTAQFGLTHEPTAQESVAGGCDVVAFSADKLLGGPQAGILIGKTQFIAKLKKHPLARAVRPDKLCLSALTATLDEYRRGTAIANIPILAMLAYPLELLQARSEKWAQLFSNIGMDAHVMAGKSTIGGGSLPGETMPTALVGIKIAQPDAFLAKLRGLPMPIIARIEDDTVLFDPRTVLPEQEAHFLRQIQGL
jgi:L-seryl-tRNA(Ser) seleniumtransferase